MATIEERPIHLVEGDEPLLGFRLSVVDEQTGDITPFPVADYDFRFIVRNTEAAGDADPDIATYLSTGASPAIVKVGADGLHVQVDVDATNTPVASDSPYRYYLQSAPLGSNRFRTIRKGQWLVEDM